MLPPIFNKLRTLISLIRFGPIAAHLRIFYRYRSIDAVQEVFPCATRKATTLNKLGLK